jgi:hypothetical protein
MIIYEELRGVLLFTSTPDVREYQFSRLIDLNYRNAIESLSLLSSTQFHALHQRRRNFMTHELKLKEIFVLHSKVSPDIHLWSVDMERDLHVLHSQVSLTTSHLLSCAHSVQRYLIEDIGFLSGVLSPRDDDDGGKEGYYLLIYNTRSYEIVHEAYFQLVVTATQTTLQPIAFPQLADIDPNHLQQRERLQMMRALMIEIESSEWFPLPTGSLIEPTTEIISVSQSLLSCIEKGGLYLFQRLTEH